MIFHMLYICNPTAFANMLLKRNLCSYGQDIALLFLQTILFNKGCGSRQKGIDNRILTDLLDTPTDLKVLFISSSFVKVATIPINIYYVLRGEFNFINPQITFYLEN